MFSRKQLRISLLFLLPTWSCSQNQAPDQPLSYPKTTKVDQVDDYHGDQIADPYRWLENLDSPETKAWVDAENQVTFSYLNQIPDRDRVKNRLTRLWNYERFTLPFKEGGRYFYTRNDGLQNQNVYYWMPSLDAPPRLLIDPNTLSKDGTVSLSSPSVSEDGKYFAYSLSDGGSDWQTFRVREVESGNDLPDVIKWAKFTGAAWTKDCRGFFYSRYDEPKGQNELSAVNYYHKLYYHRLGTPQSDDPLVYERPDQKEWNIAGGVTEDGRYLIITLTKGTERKNRVFYKDLETPGAKVVELLNEGDAEYSFIGNDGPTFWFSTDLNASRGRIIAVNTNHPERSNWKELVAESKDTLQGANVLNDMFVCMYLKDAYTQVKIFDLNGQPIRNVQLPGIGTAGGFGGRRKERETFYTYTSFNMPARIYRYDMSTGQSTVFKQPKVDFNPDDYETKQVFYNSKDGTRIPMFITYRKGIILAGRNPTFLYGYGGFNIPITPAYSTGNLVWMEMGGVYVVACLRGGGEYGKDWHDAGKLNNKQNVFDDFIAAGEWLIANKYTRPDKLAIGGGSNGGLLVGACITQRPDLFGAALPAVGVLDMLRFHKFTIGWAWASDYGCADKPDDYRILRAYSPLHNIKPGTKYPSTFITTGDHDDRVVPSHSFKFAAALQEAHAGTNPVLIRIETRAGHGAGKPTTMQIEEKADQWAFLVRNLGMDTGRLPS